MGTYNDDALRQLVELREKGGELATEQKQALVGWLQIDEDLRSELQRELEEAGHDPRPMPLSAGHEEDLRVKGLLEKPPLLQRLSDAIRKRFSRDR